MQAARACEAIDRAEPGSARGPPRDDDKAFDDYDRTNTICSRAGRAAAGNDRSLGHQRRQLAARAQARGRTAAAARFHTINDATATPDHVPESDQRKPRQYSTA